MQANNYQPLPWQEHRLRYPEAAKLTGLSCQTLRLKVMKREVPFEKCGRAVLFRAGDLVDWLSSKAVKK